MGVGTFDILGKLKTPSYSMPYFTGIGILIISIIFSLYAIKVRRFNVVPEVNFLIDKFEAKYRLLIRRVASTMAKDVKQMEKVNDDKVKWVDCSWYFLIAGLILVFIFLILVTATGNIKEPVKT